ncbi:uncharacterized protein L969DRAFT_51947 [Mixia osmundae IAM 14324]|uniref:Potassium channel domain-containing protein n=1 Tax=Mixia osmundae (strain CBS 9802 / IAM 14324 / JCM 22182 / KY 12970) TaxID=764103 RepID=G7DWR1_MIXOS|nr:uncharacterized protein L969DRAFT_20574 [Mixia osmundae IAM 14324]XP_014566739.1 uncharacterized protein L969DRAFT_51947 [Mixia osmundae IAM 14324]KEI36214.1 hypothetical protein L969DRAFT_20574 [Mixia osmundae IAM 14324]KEI38182.1 hypothetical protein L969DRAFT_51947 [Mixia osmundae IAM 14324]GAA95008.1 hypothetical protein E5Q_01663 [Mixia osmundae IAM 14324]
MAPHESSQATATKMRECRDEHANASDKMSSEGGSDATISPSKAAADKSEKMEDAQAEANKQVEAEEEFDKAEEIVQHPHEVMSSFRRAALHRIRHTFRRKSAMHRLKEFAKVAPLISAILAPLSTLMDIPALSERWYTFNGVALPDPTASLALSAVGLAFNLIANVLLMIRFSAQSSWWRLATRLSLLGWLMKTILALANLILFGITTRNGPGYSYDEGFWCAVVSVCISGIIVIMLGIHYFLEFKHSDVLASREIRVTGRHFMMSTAAMFGLIAIQALIFSRIEHWTYLEGIYFSVVVMLTIGYGDFYPTHTATRILLFFFLIANIAALAQLVNGMVTFFKQRTDQRKKDYRETLANDKKIRAKTGYLEKEATLVDEMAFLEAIEAREEQVAQSIEFAMSITVFLLFMLLGAWIFSSIEGWTYGDGLYWSYVTYSTLGLGDFSPITPGGRVIFIVWSLLAVPIVTSAVVSAVSNWISALSQRELEKRKKKTGTSADQIEEVHQLEAEMRKEGRSGNLDEAELAQRVMTKKHQERFIEHSAIVDRGLKQLDFEIKERRASMSVEDDTDNNSITTAMTEEASLYLAERILRAALELEINARSMLIATLDKSSKARTLLRADRNIQIRDLRMLQEDSEMDHPMAEQELNIILPGEDDNMDMLNDEQIWEGVTKHRESLGTLLAAGVRLKRLEGVHKQMFERRRHSVTKLDPEQQADLDADLAEHAPAVQRTDYANHKLDHRNQTV